MEKRKLNIVEKWMIVDLKHSKVPEKRIMETFERRLNRKLSRTTISKLMKRSIERGSFERLLAQGRPEKLDDEGLDVLEKTPKEEPYQTLKSISEHPIANPNHVSDRTIRSALRSRDIRADSITKIESRLTTLTNESTLDSVLSTGMSRTGQEYVSPMKVIFLVNSLSLWLQKDDFPSM